MVGLKADILYTRAGDLSTKPLAFFDYANKTFSVYTPRFYEGKIELEARIAPNRGCLLNSTCSHRYPLSQYPQPSEPSVRP